MDSKDEKNIMRAIYIPIIVSIAIGLVVGLTFAIISIQFLFKLPNFEWQLRYSPFYQEGQWKCEEENFVIISSFDEVSEHFLPANVSGAYISDGEETYNFTMSFVSKNNTNSKYAVVIYLKSETPQISYSCNYEFNLDNFVLKDISCDLGEDIFGGKTELHFKKVA